eukprot:1678805-Prymnesium_polylepis.1
MAMVCRVRSVDLFEQPKPAGASGTEPEGRNSANNAAEKVKKCSVHGATSSVRASLVQVSTVVSSRVRTIMLYDEYTHDMQNAEQGVSFFLRGVAERFMIFYSIPAVKVRP